MRALSVTELVAVQGQDSSLTSAQVLEIKANNQGIFNQKQEQTILMKY